MGALQVDKSVEKPTLAPVLLSMAVWLSRACKLHGPRALTHASIGRAADRRACLARFGGAVSLQDAVVIVAAGYAQLRVDAHAKPHECDAHANETR